MEGLSNNDRRLYKLCKEGNLREVKELIEETGKVAFVQRLKVHRKELWYVYTPLHEAAANGYKDLLSYLLELGCDVNCRSLGGDTPLHLAVSNGHVECIRALLKCNPDMRLRNNAGKTPWQVVEHRPKGCCIGSIMRSEGIYCIKSVIYAVAIVIGIGCCVHMQKLYCVGMTVPNDRTFKIGFLISRNRLRSFNL